MLTRKELGGVLQMLASVFKVLDVEMKGLRTNIHWNENEDLPIFKWSTTLVTFHAILCAH